MSITLVDVHDRMLADIAQGASVGGMTFPSGMRVPKGDWKIFGQEVRKVCPSSKDSVPGKSSAAEEPH